MAVVMVDERDEKSVDESAALTAELWAVEKAAYLAAL